MILTLAGNDIACLRLGIFNDEHQEIVPAQEIPCSPEEYLGVIDAFLQAHEFTLANVAGIVVSSADGSATALRVSHAIANALGFAREIPLYRSLDSIPLKVILPEYAQPVTITKRKKDVLNRKT